MALRREAEMADRESFDVFYEKTMPALFRALLVVAGDRELAADATAEALTRAWQQWGRLRNPRAWALTVAHNHLRAWYQRVGNREMLTGVFDDDLEVTAEALVAAAPGAAEVDPDLLKAVADLPTRQRAVVASRYLLGLRPWEVADALGIDRRTESEHHRRAMKALRERIADWEGDAL
jgi:RNA polymerase sigma factor (sigma-70 family)